MGKLLTECQNSSFTLVFTESAHITLKGRIPNVFSRKWLSRSPGQHFTEATECQEGNVVFVRPLRHQVRKHTTPWNSGNVVLF
jgi:hypothetical protein